MTDYEGHWAAEHIQKAIDTGTMTGYPDGTWQPDRALSRAEFAAVVDRMGLLGETPVDPSGVVSVFNPHSIDDWIAAGSVALSGGGRVESGSTGFTLFNEGVDGSAKVGARLGYQNKNRSWDGWDGTSIWNLPDANYSCLMSANEWQSGESNFMQWKGRTKEDGGRIMLGKIAIRPTPSGGLEAAVATRIDQDSTQWTPVVQYITDWVDLGVDRFELNRFEVEMDWSLTESPFIFRVNGIEVFNLDLITVPANKTFYDRPFEFVWSHYLSNWQGPHPDSSITISDVRVVVPS